MEPAAHHRVALDRAVFNIASYTLSPFRQPAVSCADHTSREDLGIGIFGNVVWLLLAGWWLALRHLVTAILLTVTVTGMLFARALVKLAGIDRQMIVPIE